MNAADSSKDDSLEARLRFEVEFVHTWHRAHGSPSIVLIDWTRAHAERQALGFDGRTTALRQLWDIRRDAEYLRRPRDPRWRPDGSRRRPG